MSTLKFVDSSGSGLSGDDAEEFKVRSQDLTSRIARWSQAAEGKEADARKALKLIDTLVQDRVFVLGGVKSKSAVLAVTLSAVDIDLATCISKLVGLLLADAKKAKAKKLLTESLAKSYPAAFRYQAYVAAQVSASGPEGTKLTTLSAAKAGDASVIFGADPSDFDKDPLAVLLKTQKAADKQKGKQKGNNKDKNKGKDKGVPKGGKQQGGDSGLKWYKTDTRVVQVVDVSAHPSDNTLHVLQVARTPDDAKAGKDSQSLVQVVCGVASWCPADQLLNRRVCCILNTGVGDVRGAKSAGRVMVATQEGKDGTKYIVDPPKDAAIGERVVLMNSEKKVVGVGEPDLPAMKNKHFNKIKKAMRFENGAAVFVDGGTSYQWTVASGGLCTTGDLTSGIVA